MLVGTQRLLRDAQEGGYAIGHFNTSNLEITKAIVQAAEKLNSPVIVATSPSAIAYAGIEQISNIVRTEAKNADVPVALHLDHSPTFELTKECVQKGWTSVMIDASAKPYAKNIALTKKVIQYAHRHKVSVEAELGSLAGQEGWVQNRVSTFTDPAQANDFVQKTKCDSLAIAIGTSHGARKFKGKPELDFKRLRQIDEEVGVPLVLHGSSTVPKRWVRKANIYGANLEHTAGVPEHQIRKAIRLGICKVNTDTDLRIVFDAGLREQLKRHPKIFDPRKILSAASAQVEKIIEQKIRLFKSEGQA